MSSSTHYDRLLRDLERAPSSLSRQQQPKNPPARPPTAHFLSDVPGKPLTWLWPGRIPLGHLTLLDAAPGCDLSLVALTLAACVSSGSPLPDGAPIQQGYVLLLAPYDSPAGTLKPRLEAAGGNPAHVLLIRPLVEDDSRTLARTRSFALPQDLDYLASIIRFLNDCLVILDPASAIPGLSRCLPALIKLVHQTNCAILLTRSLRESPADPLRSPGPTSPLLEGARSRLLLTPDPADERHYLLLTTRHPLCAQPAILAYDILASAVGIPTIHWLGERDRSHLARLCTGPLHSPHRQAILRFLQHSDSPQSIQEILKTTCYDYEAGRKMLVRMKIAGELVSPARGLYTTANHPCLANNSTDTPAVSIEPPVATVTTPAPEAPHTEVLSSSSVPDTAGASLPQANGALPHAYGRDESRPGWEQPSSNSPAVSVTTVPSVPDIPSPSVPNVPDTAGASLSQASGALPHAYGRDESRPEWEHPAPHAPAVSAPSSQSPTIANSPQCDVTTVTTVPNPAHNTSEVAQQQKDASP